MVRYRVGERQAQFRPSTDLGETSYHTEIIRELRKGDTDGGNADIKAAREINRNIDNEFKRYGVTP